jgi:hypothetical protein
VTNVKNKSSMKLENKIKCVLMDFEINEISLQEATKRILLSLDVVGQNEQFYCNNERMGVRCVEQCLGCFEFENKDGMNKTIWKYELKIDDLQNVIMPIGAEILSVQMQNKTPCLWALVNPDEKDTDTRYIETFGTGHPVAYDMESTREFIGTYQTRGLVFHVFEYTGV